MHKNHDPLVSKQYMIMESILKAPEEFIYYYVILIVSQYKKVVMIEIQVVVNPKFTDKNDQYYKGLEDWISSSYYG